MAAATQVPPEVTQGKALWIEIRSPDGLIWAGMARAITVPGTDGSMGILPRHAPLMSSLTVGLTRILDAKDTEIYPAPVHGTTTSKDSVPVRERFHLVTGDGFVEVFQNQVLVLVDFADDTADIDVERAKASRERAETRLRTPEENFDRARAEAALQRAIVRLRFAGAPRI